MARCFNRAESHILTWSGDGTARLWDARTGNPIGPTFKHAGPVSGALFNKDETRILTWSADPTARLWDISADLDFPADQFKTLVQALTSVELDPTTQQLKTVEPTRWRSIKANYDETASALISKYPTANQWLLFHPRTPPTSKPQGHVEDFKSSISFFSFRINNFPRKNRRCGSSMIQD